MISRIFWHNSFSRVSGWMALLASLCGTLLAKPTEPLLKQGNARIVLVGDSITGQSRNASAGFAHLMDRALLQAYPGCKPDIIALGGSGQGVNSWSGVEKRSRTEELFLDVKGIPVKATLDQHADVLVIMLGMNDVLAPYVVDEPDSLQKWTDTYRELIKSLQARLTPGVTALATPTLCTEDINSPKNRMMNQLITRATSLAAEMNLLLLPTNATMREVLKKGRSLKPDFHVTGDYVHPNEAGHLAIAMGMLRGLGEGEAARHLEEGALASLLQKAPGSASAPARKPALWRVATGLMRNKAWKNGETFDSVLAHGPVEEAIEQGRLFTSPVELGGGRQLEWLVYETSVNFTGGNAPGSVDFAAVTHAHTFEGGVAARSIWSKHGRPVHMELSTQAFAGIMHLAVYLNGKNVYAGLITSEPKKHKTVGATLKEGWNTLAFTLDHVAWQMQCTVDISPIDDDNLNDLIYSVLETDH